MTTTTAKIPPLHPLTENGRRGARACREWARQQASDDAYVRGEQECADCGLFTARGVVCAECKGTKKNPHGRYDLVCFLADTATSHLEDAIGDVSHVVARVEHELQRAALGLEHTPIPAHVVDLVRAFRGGQFGPLLCLMRDFMEQTSKQMRDVEDVSVDLAAAE